jgi:AraC family transcriptional regulator
MQPAAEAIKVLDDVRRMILRNPEAARAVALQFMRVLARQVDTDTPDIRGGLAPWQKRKVDRYLSEHLARRLQTREIAGQVSLSASHFCRVFKETYGTSPHTYIIGLRLEFAQQLMLTTEYPLSQIALLCGMADQSHLSKLFRRRMGATPGAWRRGHLPDAEAEARSRRSKAG